MINEFILQFPIATYVLFGVLCLMVGSLLNVIIHRLPIMLHAEWSKECRTLLDLPTDETRSVNLFFPRSFCPKCNTTIPFWYNIPVLSYCILLGHCHYCKTKIPVRYLLVELTCLALSLCATYHFGFHLSLIPILFFIWLIICLFFIDLDHQLLPDSLTLGLLWIGLIANTQQLFTPLPNAIFCAAITYIFLWLFIKLFYLVTGKVGMGHGDFKLMAAFGAWFGFSGVLLILLLSSITGAISGIIYLKFTSQTRETPIPFGPFLAIAGLITLFFGDIIITWYINLYR